MRVHPDTKTLALAVCSALWDYYEPRKYPWWLEDVYGWVDKWDVKASV